MGREDWFRRSTWSPSDERDFHDRLQRSRGEGSKAQYLRIQAACLAEANVPSAGIELLDLLFREYPARSELASARLQKAECLIKLGNLEAAIPEFRLCLDTERQFPQSKTECWLDFPWFIVGHHMTSLYSEAMGVLDEFNSKTNLMFPISRYRYATLRSLILAWRGDLPAAREFAKAALSAANANSSGFQRHKDVGLVKAANIESNMHRRLLAISKKI